MKLLDWICVAAFMFCAETDAAPPAEKRLWDLLSVTRLRRTDGSGISSCQKASQSIGQLLQLSQDTMFINYMHHMYMDLFLNFDVFASEERDAFVCQFSNLETLQDIINVGVEIGILPHIIRRAYNYFTAVSMYNKVILLTLLAESNEDSWMTPEEIQIKLDLIQNMESTGLLALDPEGADVFIERMNEDFGENYLQNYTAEPLSDEPLQAQANKLANAMRKVWNQHVKEMSEWYPDYSQELRQNIKEWTGLNIGGNHNDMKLFVSHLLGATNNGLPKLIQFVIYSGVIHRSLKKGYPLLVESMNDLQSDLENTVYYYYGDDIYAEDYTDYQAIMAQINENLLSLLESLREMGILSLEDDL